MREKHVGKRLLLQAFKPSCVRLLLNPLNLERNVIRQLEHLDWSLVIVLECRRERERRTRYYEGLSNRDVNL